MKELMKRALEELEGCARIIQIDDETLLEDMRKFIESGEGDE